MLRVKLNSTDLPPGHEKQGQNKKAPHEIKKIIQI